MKIATKTRYGLRFMIDLAQHWGQGPVPMREIAQRQEVSKKYLEQVAAPLQTQGLICVSRGHTGGYELSRPPENITMADIMSATEGGLGILDCLDDSLVCSRADSCLSIKAWSGLQKSMIEYLASQNLKDLAAG
ncbi:MAG: Rrf2 family transcriptional regulator [Coriobacteriia bacterium]|nr:Rrf2 family transcriptional regulator [Coriobacteriia bacterium]